jgi:hypothetical protein
MLLELMDYSPKSLKRKSMDKDIKQLKILCTGNPNKKGIAKSISDRYENSDFIYLSNGYDLTNNEGQDKFRLIIKNYDVFINVSQLSDNSQEKLLKIAYEEGMKGHVFNIGSIAEYKKWEWYDIDYANEKRSLRETSLELCSEFFKTTHIIVCGFQDSSNDHPERMDAIEIVKVIEYILNSKVNIPLIGIEKINDEESQKLLLGNKK